MWLRALCYARLHNCETRASARNEIDRQLEEARSSYNGPEHKNQKEALIHTGIVSIEAAIRQYVQKYAKTAKIRNIVDTFMEKLNEVGCFEETKKQLAENQEEGARIAEQIAAIREKVKNAEEAKTFKKDVDDAVLKVNDESKKVVDRITQKFQERITKRIDSYRGREIDKDDVDAEVLKLEKFARKLDPEFESELDELIGTNLINTSNTLLEGYRNKLASLAEEIKIDNIKGIKIDPLELMKGSISIDSFDVEKLVRTREVEDGGRMVPVPRKPILGIGLRDWLFGMKEEWEAVYKTVEFIQGDDIAQEFLQPTQRNLYDNGDKTLKYAKQQSKNIADRFKKEIKHLDDVLEAKLSELESYATDENKAKERIKELEENLEWLEMIKSRVDSILEI